jgi:hypothetical protein
MLTSHVVNYICEFLPTDDIVKLHKITGYDIDVLPLWRNRIVSDFEPGLDKKNLKYLINTGCIKKIRITRDKNNKFYSKLYGLTYLEISLSMINKIRLSYVLSQMKVLETLYISNDLLLRSGSNSLNLLDNCRQIRKLIIENLEIIDFLYIKKCKNLEYIHIISSNDFCCIFRSRIKNIPSFVQFKDTLKSIHLLYVYIEVSELMLRECKNLEEIIIKSYDYNNTDTVVIHLPYDSKKLRKLEVSNFTIGNIDILAESKVLEELMLYNVCIKKNIPFLSSKKLSYIKLGCNGIATIAKRAGRHDPSLLIKFSNLKDGFSYSRNNVLLNLHFRISGIPILTNYEKLRVLHLSGTRVSNIEILASCRKLEKLDLSYTHISNISVLAHCKDLEDINLSHTLVSDISALAYCKKIKSLNLSYSQVSDVSALVDCKKLIFLDLYDTLVSDTSILMNYKNHAGFESCDELVFDTSDLESEEISDKDE